MESDYRPPSQKYRAKSHRDEDAVRRQQPVYNTRRGSLGYTRTDSSSSPSPMSSSSLRRKFDPPKDSQRIIEHYFAEAERENLIIKTIQPIFQGHNPALKKLEGICQGLGTEWLMQDQRHPLDGESSRFFGHAINENLPQIIERQQLSDELRTEYINCPNDTGGRKDIIEKQIDNLEWAGLNGKEVGTAVMMPDQARHCAREITNRMRSDGYYRVFLKNHETRDCHLFEARLSSKNKDLARVMDPNTYEYLAKDHESLTRLLGILIFTQRWDSKYTRADIAHAPFATESAWRD